MRRKVKHVIEIPKKFDIEKARVARANEARREQIEAESTKLKQLLQNAEKIAETYRLKCGQLEQSQSAAALESERAANDQLTRESVELKAEIKKLRSVVLTIRVLECDMHKLQGHECFAKHWALSLLDRVKRMKNENKS